MITVSDLLDENCEDELVYEPDCELIESGLLDSYAMIELFSALEDAGLYLPPPRIDRSPLKPPAAIQKLVDDYGK